MKKLTKTLVWTMAFLTACVSIVIFDTANAQTLIETETATGIGVTIDSQVAPNPGNVINTVREKLRANNVNTPVKTLPINKVENGVKVNNELRERLTEQKASTTQFRKEVLEERKDVRQERVDQIKDVRLRINGAAGATSTIAERRMLIERTRLEVFKIRQNALVRQLNLSISNLEQIASRIQARIEKAKASGRDMAQAESLLGTAKNNIVTAKAAIKAVADFVPSAVNVATSTNDSAAVDLSKPREVGNEAIKAIKTVRESLNLVVRAIAHAMGMNLNTGTSTNADSSASTATQ